MLFPNDEVICMYSLDFAILLDHRVEVNSKVSDRSRGRSEGSFFNSYNTEG